MVQYLNTSVRGMQGVAAKNDARDRSDQCRRLYCDDVPAERPHRDGLLCRFLSAFLLQESEDMEAGRGLTGARTEGLGLALRRDSAREGSRTFHSLRRTSACEMLETGISHPRAAFWIGDPLDELMKTYDKPTDQAMARRIFG